MQSKATSPGAGEGRGDSPLLQGDKGGQAGEGVAAGWEGTCRRMEASVEQEGDDGEEGGEWRGQWGDGGSYGGMEEWVGVEEGWREWGVTLERGWRG